VQRESQRKNRIEWARKTKEQKLREASEKRQHELLL
jgi:vacuolar-type H+-ATPase subunit H